MHPFDERLARRPYTEVKRVKVDFEKPVRRSLAEMARRLARPDGYSDIDTRIIRAQDAEAAGITFPKLSRWVYDGLRSTEVLGVRAAPYTNAVALRLDSLVCNGAAYHNDTAVDWRDCLFWVLCLDATSVEFRMPDAGVRIRLTPGDLLVFDPCLVHGLCRTGDGGRALESSFTGGSERRDLQTFLAGELVLSRRRWAMMGCPWRKREDFKGFVDLSSATFNEETGAVRKAEWI